MQNKVQFSNANPPVTTPLARSPWRRGYLLIPLGLCVACLALSPPARAACQEGCDLGKINTFLGGGALINNTTGDANVAIGTSALFANTTGFLNTAIGAGALDLNTTGSLNTANGSSALASNTTGDHNSTTGYSNTATGAFALDQNTTGSSNTAIGDNALARNLTGSSNIALGITAGAALTTGDNNIDIGNGGLAGESSRIRIGTEGTQTATYIAGIRQTQLANGTALAVGITADGQMGVRASSARFKEAIKPMDKASEAILG